MNRSTHVPAADGGPAFHLYRAEKHIEGLALRLGVTSGFFDAGAWMSVEQARQLAAHLIEHADAYEAQFPAQVAA